VKTTFLDWQNIPPDFFDEPITWQEALKLRREMLFTPLSEAHLLDVIPFMGVPEFKQVQMYKNFRQFLPPEFQNITCPKPSDDVLKSIQNEFESFTVDDETTKKTIKKYFEKTGEILDPHSAIGIYAGEEFIKSKNYQGEFVVSLATAHPAKFPDSVIAAGVPNPTLPNFLKDLFKNEEKFEVLENNYEAVTKFISERV
jgi:threonine synthase